MSTGELSAGAPAATAYAICALHDIPSRRARGFQLLRCIEGEPPKAWSVFMVRWGSQVYGYVNVCPPAGFEDSEAGACAA